MKWKMWAQFNIDVNIHLNYSFCSVLYTDNWKLRYVVDHANDLMLNIMTQYSY